ncbi:hypothetical protein S1361_01410 [Streptomyces cyanogenus]|uniref:Uncharacterized protein n=1 Tax=Streptomyces cyanogenus TaxID=80860 RepID=A0ABX7THN5_STRCY|nr:hypothetical protein S1361_01410 [Streptomyces cyanogenus]
MEQMLTFMTVCKVRPAQQCPHIDSCHRITDDLPHAPTTARKAHAPLRPFSGGVTGPDTSR